MAWFILNSAFLVVFGLELLLRIRADGSRTFLDRQRGAAWNSFDAVVIFVGALDLWFLTWLETAGGPFGELTVLRVVRLRVV